MKNHDTFNKLVEKLQEIFQIDRPDLDFGIYRILNARRSQIDNFLTHDLRAKVESAFGTASSTHQKSLQQELQQAIENAKALGMDPDLTPKVQELTQELAQHSSNSNVHENAVYSHLLTFFSRYYDEGDFISQRRYKGDTYAIPYAGEEVVLHWANKDQYYTKSSENFSNYTFTLEDERRVHFKLVAANTEKDNRKEADDKRRRFKLATPRVIERLDDDGESYEESIEILHATEHDLTIHFEYLEYKKSQKNIDAETLATLAKLPIIKESWASLLGKNSPLAKHLSTYTAKNTADYFIHKDLKGFLRRELDFYIKSEVMNLDDVSSSETFNAIEKNLRMIQCLRSVAHDLIDFLAQLENFQKKLWLKKKFVVSADYCITLDLVPEELYPDIVAIDAQWEQWKHLGVWDGKSNKSVDTLKRNPYWMLDTQTTPLALKHHLLTNSPPPPTTTI